MDELKNDLAGSARYVNPNQSITANQTVYYWANLMVQNVLPQNNTYNTSVNLVTWAGQNGATAYQCTTVCSGFLTKILTQTYGYTSNYFQTWTGSTSPHAATYYNEIVTHDHFNQISQVSQVLQNDIIALQYPAGSSSTGHIMIVASTPVLRTASAPLITGTSQYEVTILDCSSTGHGSTDTRYISSGNFRSGAGRGVFRLYVNSTGSIVGYTWSTYSNSTYYTQSQRQLAIGRLVP